MARGMDLPTTKAAPNPAKGGHGGPEGVSAAKGDLWTEFWRFCGNSGPCADPQSVNQ